jgi:hypothetical protein
VASPIRIDCLLCGKHLEVSEHTNSNGEKRPVHHKAPCGLLCEGSIKGKFLGYCDPTGDIVISPASHRGPDCDACQTPKGQRAQKILDKKNAKRMSGGG